MNDKAKGKSSSLIRLGIIVVVAAAVLAAFRWTPLSLSDFTPENVKRFIQGFGSIAPVVFVLIYALRSVVLVLPVGIMSLAGGLAFGKSLGTVYILIGATAGSCLSFLLARYVGRGFVEKLGVMRRGRLKSFDENVGRSGFRVILFMRLVPLFQYDAVNFGAGLSKMKFRDYALGSLIGMAPGGFVNAFLGSSLDNILSTQFLVALAFFMILMLVPALYKLSRRRRREMEGVKAKSATGHCPDCTQPVGPIAILRSWESWGRFLCPNCGSRLRFASWLLFALLLVAAFWGLHRLLIAMIVSETPAWVGFAVPMVLALLVLFGLPAVWSFRARQETE